LTISNRIRFVIIWIQRTFWFRFKCKICGSQFEEKERLDIHKNVHGRKAKISEYGNPEFNQDRLRG